MPRLAALLLLLLLNALSWRTSPTCASKKRLKIKRPNCLMDLPLASSRVQLLRMPHFKLLLRGPQPARCPILLVLRPPLPLALSALSSLLPATLNPLLLLGCQLADVPLKKRLGGADSCVEG